MTNQVAASGIPERWEFGSELQMMTADASPPTAEKPPWRAPVWLGSGRDALRALLEHGRRTRGWKRLWVPSFFCQEVVHAMAATGLAVESYDDAPWGPPRSRTISARAGDVLFVHNPFGLREAALSLAVDGPRPEVIEDHTHDPWSAWAHASTADFCVASLRKTLPVPLAAVVWSPRDWQLPAVPPVSDERRTACDEKLAAMVLKRLYLAGGDVEKSEFRALALSGEERIASGAISGLPPAAAALLRTFPTATWRSQRRSNHAHAKAALGSLRWAEVLEGQGEGSCPFSVTIVVDSPERRERVRRRLVERSVYPAILWSLEDPAVAGIPAEHRDLSRRILSIHCDMRYTARDMERVADVLRAAGEETDR